MARSLIRLELSIDQTLINRYAELTNDYNPLHVDPDFAAKSPFGGIIAHGTTSLNLIWESLCATLGPAAAQGAILDIRFTKPVRIGDTLWTRGEEDQPGQFSVQIINQDGINVIEGMLALAPDAVCTE